MYKKSLRAWQARKYYTQEQERGIMKDLLLIASSERKSLMVYRKPLKVDRLLREVYSNGHATSLMSLINSSRKLVIKQQVHDRGEVMTSLVRSQLDQCLCPLTHDIPRASEQPIKLSSSTAHATSVNNTQRIYTASRTSSYLSSVIRSVPELLCKFSYKVPLHASTNSVRI